MILDLLLVSAGFGMSLCLMILLNMVPHFSRLGATVIFFMVCVFDTRYSFVKVSGFQIWEKFCISSVIYVAVLISILVILIMMLRHYS